MKTKLLFLSVAVVLGIATSSRAELIDMEVHWSGANATIPNGASAVATFTLDTSFINPSGDNWAWAPSWNPGPGHLTTEIYLNLQLTVSGSGAGNGVFDISDFEYIGLVTGDGSTPALDFHSELLGQVGPLGGWGSPLDNIGGFYLYKNFTNAPLGPNSVHPFTFLSGGNDEMVLSSFSAASSPVVAVPETGTWVMGIVALGVSAFLVRRRAAQS